LCCRYYIPGDGDCDDFDILLSGIAERYDDTPELAQMKLGEIFPTNIAPVITPEAPALMKWGFVSPYLNGTIINARLETAAVKPMFRGLFYTRRCLVPASHYFEWKSGEAGKQKYAIGLKGPIYMAGLYRLDESLRVPSFVILTRPAASDIGFIHDRMPVLVPEEGRADWLKGRMDVRELLVFGEEGLM
jgi:putative SOS response-associated peptidase YedK